MTYLGESGGKQREPVNDLLVWQRLGTSALSSKSPFYDRLFELCIADHNAGNADIAALLERTPMSYDAAVGLRLLAGVQRCWLAGIASELDAVWPTAEQSGDADRAYAVMQTMFRDPPALLLDWLTRDPQTNEVGRSAGLAIGLDLIAQGTGLPVRLFEIGSSGGLNLRIDEYGYTDAHGHSWGNANSPLQFGADAFSTDLQFWGHAVIAERRGCDLNPIDASTEAGGLQLQSYVWPDQQLRVKRLHDALRVARKFPVMVDRSSAAPWIDEHFVSKPEFVTVLMHSIMWQYLPESEQTEIRALIDQRGSVARSDAPMAWLTLEPSPEMVHANVTVTVWPGGEPRVVATSGFHGPPIRGFV